MFQVWLRPEVENVAGIGVVPGGEVVTYDSPRIFFCRALSGFTGRPPFLPLIATARRNAGEIFRTWGIILYNFLYICIDTAETVVMVVVSSRTLDLTEPIFKRS